MYTYRVFVQDRGRGLYSGLRDVEAPDARHALVQIRGISPERLKAIRWPPTPSGVDWLDRYVNPGNRGAGYTNRRDRGR